MLFTHLLFIYVNKLTTNTVYKCKLVNVYFCKVKKSYVQRRYKKAVFKT